MAAISALSAESLSDPQIAVSILSAASDITVMMTPDGVICNDVVLSAEMPKTPFKAWAGKALSETVTNESKTKIQQLLSAANSGQTSRWRQVNHPVNGSADLPVSYNALKAGPHGHIIAFGRDMSAVAQIQRKLLAAEQSIEQEYHRLRSAETRFRVLMQSSTDAILIVDSKSERVGEVNAAAATLLNKPTKKLTGAEIEDVFEDEDRPGVKAAFEALRNTGRSDDVVLRHVNNDQQAVVSFSMFRQESSSFFLLRIVPYSVGTSANVFPRAQSKVVKIISEMPDGFVVTDPDLKVLTANSAFLEFSQLASEEQARGMTLDHWLGRPGVDVSHIVSHLKDKGEIRNFQTIMRGQFGAIEDVIVSAVAVREGETPCYGFNLHQLSRSVAAEQGGKQDRALLRSVDDFTRLVGKLPLKELVRESTDIIERLCIEAALQMNGDNRANAAELLGLSRQSLYMKMHRYGIDGPDQT